MKELLDVLNENGEYIGKIDTRESCHQNGLWHKAVVVFILNSKNQILLQKRSPKKKLWPDMWDISAGGHVLSGEFGFQATIRECYEELGIKLERGNISFIGSTTSMQTSGNIVNKHFNEYYIAAQDVDVNSLSLQEEEVSEVKWIDKDEIMQKIHNNYQGITDKAGCWDYLARYLDWLERS